MNEEAEPSFEAVFANILQSVEISINILIMGDKYDIVMHITIFSIFITREIQISPIYTFISY
jgi:hypothetical protein